jgi:hypothetical protein
VNYRHAANTFTRSLMIPRFYQLMKNIISVLILLASLQASSQIIPDSIAADWSHAGFEGSVPSYGNVTDVTTFGAIPNDSIDDLPAVAAAINALGGHAGVIYFPPGNYVLQASINLPDSVILRGAGSDSTLFTFDFSNTVSNCINIAHGASNLFYPIVSGYNKGSADLLVAGADTIFAAGDEIEIREANGAWDTNPAAWAAFSVGHLSRIDSISGDTIYMAEALRMDLDAALNPEIRKVVTRKYCGLECFKMTRLDSSAASVNYGVYFYFASDCWMRGVESEKSVCAHVAIETSRHIDISGCYIHDSYIYDGVSTHGYGVVVFAHSCSNKIENNIFRMLRHAMITKQGANGNVFGYNYSRETNRSEAIADYAADICLHGHYAFANLYEGNIAQNLQVDQAWGPSGPFNTFFRNKIENYGIIMTSGMAESDRQNFVGNDVSNTALFHGNYTLAGSNHFGFGNNIKGTITPNGTGSLSDISYYLDSIPPAFWNIPAAMPSIGTPNMFSADINPAFERYNSGGLLTLCGYEPDSVDTSLVTPVSEVMLPAPGVNYFFRQKHIIIEIMGDENEAACIELFSASGQRILFRKINLQRGYNNFSVFAEGIASGLYLLNISAGDRLYRSKIGISE